MTFCKSTFSPTVYKTTFRVTINALNDNKSSACGEKNNRQKDDKKEAVRYDCQLAPLCGGRALLTFILLLVTFSFREGRKLGRVITSHAANFAARAEERLQLDDIEML
jgi:hypothetical protein